MKYIGQFLKYLLITILILAVLIVIIIQSPMFKNRLKNKVVNFAQPYIDGQLSVGSLEGNLFTSLTLKDIAIERQDKKVVGIKEIFIDYSPVALFYKKVIVPEFVLREPDVTLVKQETGWNITGMIKTGEPAEEPQAQSSFGWQLDFPSIRIDSGHITLAGMQASGIRVPDEIRDIQLDLAFGYSDEFLNLKLNKLTLETRNPDVKLEELESSTVEVVQEEMDTAKVELETETTKLYTQFEVENFDQPQIDASLQAKPLSFDEMRKIFKDLPLYGRLTFSLDVHGTLNDLNTRLNLSHKGGKAEFTGNFGIGEEPYRYDLKGSLLQINLAEFTLKPELRSNLNLTFDVAGAGTEWGKINAEVSVAADSGFVMGRSFRSIILEANVRDDSLNFDLALHKGNGNLNVAGSFVDNETEAAYKLTGDVRDLNLQEVTSDTVMATNLNFNFDLDGQGLQPDSMQGKLVADFSSSTINKIKLDTAHAAVTLKNRLLEVEKFRIKSPIVQMKAKGKLGMERSSAISFSAEFDDLARAADAFGMDSLAGKGKLSGKVTGQLDSFFVDARLNFKKIKHPQIIVSEFGGNFTGQFSGKSKDLEIEGKVTQAEAFNFNHLNSNFTINYRDSLIGFDIEVEQPEKFFVESGGDLLLRSEGYEIRLQTLGFDVFDQTWEKTGTITEILYKEPRLEVSGLTLTSDDQSITLSGSLGGQQLSDLKLQAANLDVEKFMELLNPNVEFTGRLDLETTLTQTLAMPKIDGSFSIFDGEYYDRDFDELRGNFDYQNQQIDWRLLLSQSEGDTILQFTGFVPYRLSLSPFENELLTEQPIDIKFHTPGLDLAFVQLFIDGIKELEGTLIADVTLKNTLQDLSGGGEIRLVEAELKIPGLGVEYEDIEIDLVLSESEVVVNDFHIESGDGDLTITGGSLSLSQQQIDKFKLQLRADDFEAMNTDKLQAVVDGKVDISGSVQEIIFNGDLTVVEAVVYYPAWMPEEGAVELTDKPFFVILEDTMEFDSAGAIRFQEVDIETITPFTETEFYKNIRGKLSLTIDRNTWLRSEEANIEVEGTLEMQKEGAEFVLFGSVSTVRGYYELQGRRFQIEEGEITFKGDPEFNPDIRLTAVYEYRDLTEEGTGAEIREMTVTITGTVKAPEFEFTIDGQHAEQKDVFAILLFGRPLNELTISQNNRASEESGLSQQAQGFFAGQLMQRLSQRVAAELNLDVLQIESGEDLGDTRVRVGEYVTKDVFVSVTQDFGVEGEQKVKLEYKLPEKIVFLNLFLQALRERQGNNAVDIIWKHEW